MRQGLCNGMVSVRPSVCPSVCPSYRPLQQCAAGLLLWYWQADGIDRLLHGWRPAARRTTAYGNTFYIQSHTLAFHSQLQHVIPLPCINLCNAPL